MGKHASKAVNIITKKRARIRRHKRRAQQLAKKAAGAPEKKS